VTSTVGGLVLSFYMGLKPGGTIVLLAVGFFLLFHAIAAIRGTARKS
jgi:zinc transport system permease protein